MRAVKKVGLIENIIPTREELNSIHSFRKALLDNRAPVYFWRTKEKKIVNLSINESGYFDLDIMHHYLDIPQVNYVAHSKYLLEKRKENFHTDLGYSVDRIFSLWGSEFDNPDELIINIANLTKMAEDEPIKLSLLGSNQDWIYKGFHYSTEGPYTDEEFKLLILEEFDKERKKFEKLRNKFRSSADEALSKSRPRIPERIRIQVWRRDGGKCVRCGSRENLEYDHIIPISKGGSNTTRNIELLCQSCNRTKGNRIE